ncbi:MAG: 2-oxo acid dehydrogenase subunit E2 [Candidatus Heimdallarchaeota archaeon]|nr:2-oxo acid dehydrogenase subunit E2 [Candidatus Heimdallarchaeota archaeon]
MPRRPDAELIKTSKFRELEFYVMPTRAESMIFYYMQIDLTHTLEFLEEYNKNRSEEDKLTLFQLLLTAGVRTIAYRPKVNRFVAGRRLWQRNQILFSFVVNKSKTEVGEEVLAMIEFDPFDTLETVQKRVSEKIHEARYGENKNEKDIKFYGAMPRFLIRFIFWFVRWLDEHNHPPYFITRDMPLWCSVFIAHLGSINIDSVYHHLYNLGTASFFITIGKIHKATVLNQETNDIEIKQVMDLRLTIDDRIASGIYTGRTVDMLKNFIEHPEPLLEPPALTDEQLDALKLKKYKKERLAREKQRRKELRQAKRRNRTKQ